MTIKQFDIRTKSKKMKTLGKNIFMSILTVFMFGFISTETEPKGWEKLGTNQVSYKVGVDNQISQHGQKSAFIESIDEIHIGFCTLKQICSGEYFKGKRVKMTGYIKSQGTLDTVNMWARVDNLGAKLTIDFDNMNNRPIIGTKDWKKYEIVFDVPNAKCAICYGNMLSGVGKTWFDNVSLEIVDKSVRTTAYPLFASWPSYAYDMIPEKPINLDFEE
jgi:hypothetical protein